MCFFLFYNPLATNGGKRFGAGRKKGSFAQHTLANMKAKQILAQMVEAEIVPIANALIEKARKGDVPATKELLDRTWGKAEQPLTGKDGGDLIMKIINNYGNNDPL